MKRNSSLRVMAACLGAVMAFSAVEIAEAAPMRVQGLSEIAPQSLITDVRVRRRVRHHRRYRSNAAVPAAVLGLFGTALGAAIAGDRYDNYSSYSYGYPDSYGYGYDPSYLGDPGYGYVTPNYSGGGYVGGGRRGGGGFDGGGHRGGGGGHAGGGPRGGGGGHAAAGGGGHPGGGGGHAGGGGGGHPGGGKH